MSSRDMLAIANVVRAVRSDADCAHVVQLPMNVRIFPPEVWVPSLGAWVREDGFSIHGDHRHGFERVYPGIIGRWRIRRALRAAISRARGDLG